jgi:hypothetical protein
MATYAWDDNSYLGSSTFVLQGDGSAQWRTGVGYTLPQMSSANVPAGLVSVDIVFPTAMAASGAGLFLGAAPPPWITTPPVVPLPPVSWLPMTPPPTNTNYFGASSLTVGQTATLTTVHPGGKLYLMGQRGSGPEAGRGFISRINLRPLAPLPGPPTITKLIPTSGPDTGGTLVDIIGANLTGATGVDFGGVPGTGLIVDPSGGLATVTTPAHTAGPYPVTITTPAGTSAAKTFTFEAPPPPGTPTLTGIDPASGTETGGTPVLLTGTNLAGTIGVDFGGSTATIITTTTTAILVTTPAHAAGTVDVTATDGATTTDPLAFEFTEATGPVIDGPDVIANLVALLTSELGVPVSSRRSPTATKDSDPSVVVRRTGGPSKGVASDNPTITIEAWAPTTTESFQLLQSARLVVIEAAEQGRAGLRRYDEFAGPADLPDPSTTNPRHTLTASVVTRLE